MESFKEEKKEFKENYSDAELRAMSETELEEFIQSNYGHLGGLGDLFFSSLPYDKQNNINRAKKILHEKAEEKEKQQKKALDDGSVKGLILSGDYSKISPYIHIQQIKDGTITWIEKTSNDYGLRTDSEGDILWSIAEERAQNAVTISRRRFKKDEIIMFCYTDDFDNVKDGIVFTEDKIYSFDGGKPEYIIEYAEIEDADFTSSTVIIKTVDRNKAELYCGDDEEYSQSMYNLIMDIKDRLKES